MKMFKLPTQIHRFSTVKDFCNEFEINERDLILTHEFLKSSFLDELGLSARIIVQESYGSGEPSNIMIDDIIRAAQIMDYDRVIALGGGTVIDIAKLLIFDGKANTLAMFDKNCEFNKTKELIVIPTTCGTGSEVTNISIAEIKEKNTKMGLAIDELYPDYAVLIPDVVKGLPYDFFVYSSIDALIHACESYVSPNANEYTDMFASKAIEMILKGYADIIDKGAEHRVEIMEDFVIASNYAGISFGNAGVGAVHALSYPLGGNYHVPHGEANYLFFIEVFKRYNEINPGGKLLDLKSLISSILECDKDNAFEGLYKVLEELIKSKPLRTYGMEECDIIGFTEGVIEKQQRLLANNYVALEKHIIEDIYRSLY